MSIAETIRIILIKKKMTVSELAEKTGQSQPNLTNKLKRDDFKVNELRKIAAALNCELELNFIDKDSKTPVI